MNIVVVGGGLAARQGRRGAPRRRATTATSPLVGAEPHLPYERPPLSKGLLLGTDEPDSVFVHDAGVVRRPAASSCGTGAEVTGLDLDRAPGHRRRRPRSPTTGCCWPPGPRPAGSRLADGSGAPVAYLRTLDDSLALASTSARRLRDRSAAAGSGSRSPRRPGPPAATSPWSSRRPAPARRPRAGGRDRSFADLHREHGVDLRLGATVDAIEPDGDGAVGPARGRQRRRPPTWSWSASGADPRRPRPEPPGLAVDHGVLVDARLAPATRTCSPPATSPTHDHPVLGRRIRVEHWDTAIDQGTHAAARTAGRRRAVQPAAVLLHRPVRPRHGVRRPRRARRATTRWSSAATPAGRVFTALWLTRRPRAGRHARQRLGRDRRTSQPRWQ